MAVEKPRYISISPSLRYVPRGVKPAVRDLYDDSRYRELVGRIEASGVSGELKEFLKLAATRFIVVDFEKVAEFYAQEEPEVQRLFEEQALVLIDYGDALEKGFIKLTKRLNELYAKEQEEKRACEASAS